MEPLGVGRVREKDHERGRALRPVGNLQTPGVQPALQREAHLDGKPPHLRWTYDRSERTADGAIHALGIGLGVAGAILLLVLVAKQGGPADLASALVYGGSLLAVLGISAAYNMWPLSPTKWMLRRLDHSAIYVLIAGTYTPFATQLRPPAVAAALLVGIWATAAVGIVLKLLLPGRLDGLSILLYLALGWSGVLVSEALINSLAPSTLWPIGVGGILYTIGVAFHLWSALRFQNAIWHGFVLVAAAVHYWAVLDCLVLSRA